MTPRYLYVMQFPCSLGSTFCNASRDSRIRGSNCMCPQYHRLAPRGDDVGGAQPGGAKRTSS